MLLWCGIVGSVLFTGTFVVEGATREGYDAWRQPISALSLGAGGWVQGVNFIAFGLLLGCFAGGLRGALAPGAGSTWAPRLQAAAALGLILDGVFAQDPALGYPPGTPAPTTPSMHAVLHLLGATLVFTALPLRCFALARRFAEESGVNRRWRGWAIYSVATGVVFWALLAAFAIASGTQSGPAGLFEKLASVVMFGLRDLAGVAAAGTGRRSVPGSGARGKGAVAMTGQGARPATPPVRTEPSPTPTPGWVSAIVILAALLAAAGGLVAQVRPTLLLSAGERMSAAADVYAGYLVSRNLALAVMLLATLILGARRLLTGLMVLTALIQIIDAVVDSAGGRWTLVPGVLALGVAFLVGAARLSPRPLWRPGAWDDTAPREPATGAAGLGEAEGDEPARGGIA